MRRMMGNRNNASTGFHPNPQFDTYRRQDTRVEYQLFSNDYFSNADVHLYFGNVFVDDIISLNFTLEEQIRPIYGYHSYTYDAVARGNRIIRGEFSINFTSVGYLQEIIENADAIEFALSDKAKKLPDIDLKHTDLTIEDILKIYGKESFNEIADAYEKEIWGDDSKTTYLTPGASTYFQRTTPFGFDIKINYGAVSQTLGAQYQGFYNKAPVHPNITVDRINGVQLTGLQKNMSTSDQGRPLTETYSFIAQDLNGKSTMY